MKRLKPNRGTRRCLVEMRDGAPLIFSLQLSRQTALMYVALGLFLLACGVSQWTPDLGYGETFLTVSADNDRYPIVKAVSVLLIPLALLLIVVYVHRTIWRFSYLHVSHLGIRLPRAFVSWNNYLSHQVELQPVQSRFVDPPIEIKINVKNAGDIRVRMNPVHRLFAWSTNRKSPLQVIIPSPEHSVEYIDKMLNRCRDSFKTER